MAFGEISYLLSFPTLNHIDAHMGAIASTHTGNRGIDHYITPDQAHYVMSAAGFELCAG